MNERQWDHLFRNESSGLVDVRRGKRTCKEENDMRESPKGGEISVWKGALKGINGWVMALSGCLPELFWRWRIWCPFWWEVFGRTLFSFPFPLKTFSFSFVE